MNIISSNKDETEITVHVDELKKYVKAVRKEALQEALDSLPKEKQNIWLPGSIRSTGVRHYNRAISDSRANIAALLDKE